jgi:hypothetical protein
MKETADIDVTNNTWPKVDAQVNFSIYKAKQAARGKARRLNPMQKALRIVVVSCSLVQGQTASVERVCFFNMGTSCHKYKAFVARTIVLHQCITEIEAFAFLLNGLHVFNFLNSLLKRFIHCLLYFLSRCLTEILLRYCFKNRPCIHGR